MSALDMGTKDDPNGLVIVLPAPPPQTVIVEKRILGGAFALSPGQTAQFEVLVANPTGADLSNVILTDTLTMNGTSVTTPVPVGTLAANEGRFVALPSFTAPASGVVTNAINVIGCAAPCSSVTVPVRRPVINELVVEPQRDWNDSSGGNNTPFDATPGAGAVTLDDQWVEILTNTGSPDELKNWTLQFVDTTGAPVTLTLSASNVKAMAGSPHVVIGAPGKIAPTSTVTLRDNLGNVVDVVDLASITAALGPATSVANEAIARHPDGVDSNTVTDFMRGPATIGAPNP
jgi:uncharacterized repeat protein (TIGR01451 family)